MKNATAVYAVSTNNVIGINVDGVEKLPWSLKQDLAFFKRLTEGHIVIMGMKTFESMGRKPLPNRTNIVLTRQQLTSTDHLIFSNLSTLENFLDAYEGTRKIFVIGGVETFNLLSRHIGESYVTHVDVVVDFPQMTFMHQKLLTGKESEIIMMSETDEYQFKVVHYTERTQFDE